MKPAEIIFYTKYNNATRFCTRNELKACKNFSLLGKEWNTKLVTEALLLKDCHTLEADTPGINSASASNAKAISFSNIEAAEFTVTAKTREKLEITLSFGDTSSAYAVISFHNTSTPIFDKKSQGVIILDILQDPKINIKRKAAESFALSLGLNLLCNHNGDWNRPLADYGQAMDYTQFTPEELQSVLAKLDQQLETKEASLKALVREYNIQLSKLEYQSKENNKLLTSLEASLKSLSKVNPVKEIPSQEEKGLDPSVDYVQILQEKLQGKRLCIVGGMEAWQAKLPELFPASSIIESKNFAPSKMENIDILVINTNYVGHDLTKKAQAIANSKGIKIIFTSKHNLQRFAEEVLFSLN